MNDIQPSTGYGNLRWRYDGYVEDRPCDRHSYKPTHGKLPWLSISAYGNATWDGA